MRNPLKRLGRRDHVKVPLRERLAAAKGKLAGAKDRAGRAIAVSRILLKAPAPPPAPVDRLALINYATWLYHERRLACLELYPHAGIKADGMVHADVHADEFHFPRRGDWKTVPQPSTRAVEMLDRLGIDWRADRGESMWSDDKPLGVEAAKLPHGGLASMRFCSKPSTTWCGSMRRSGRSTRPATAIATVTRFRATLTSKTRGTALSTGWWTSKPGA